MKAAALKALLLLVSWHMPAATTHTPLIPAPLYASCPGYPHGGTAAGNPCAGNGTTGPTTPAIPHVWTCIADKESGDEDNPPNDGAEGAWGYWQEVDSSFHSATGLYGHANWYSKMTQFRAAIKIQQSQGWGAWPISSGLCGV